MGKRGNLYETILRRLGHDDVADQVRRLHRLRRESTALLDTKKSQWRGERERWSSALESRLATVQGDVGALECELHGENDPVDTTPGLYAYIGYRQACGCIVGVVADEGDQETAADVGEFIMAGLIVQRVSLKFTRDHTLGCSHQPKREC